MKKKIAKPASDIARHIARKLLVAGLTQYDDRIPPAIDRAIATFVLPGKVREVPPKRKRRLGGR